MHKLSLLIPIYNEEPNIVNLLTKLSEVPWGLPCEFIFVDDCSKDRSRELLDSWISEHSSYLQDKNISVQVFSQPKNCGKGAALHKAIDLATGTICIVQDADFEYDPLEIPSLILPIIAEKADVVYGSRFKKTSLQVHRTFHYFVNRTLTMLSNILSGIYLSDMETCYKAIRSEILKNLNLTSPRFGFEVEVTAHLARLKVRFMEVPISYFPRNYMEGKKISWKDGLAALYHILHFNIFFNDKKRFKMEIPKKFLLSGYQWL
jgi:glycosyltransferase involved in cell wall biosynthesis